MILVFGTLKTDDQPQVRSGRPLDIPAKELHDGIGRVTIQTHGDDPTDFFINIEGIDERACLDAYDRTFHALKLVLPWIWGGDTPTVRVELIHDGEELTRMNVEMDLVGWMTRSAEDGRYGVRAMVLR